MFQSVDPPTPLPRSARVFQSMVASPATPRRSSTPDQPPATPTSHRQILEALEADESDWPRASRIWWPSSVSRPRRGLSSPPEPRASPPERRPSPERDASPGRRRRGESFEVTPTGSPNSSPAASARGSTPPGAARKTADGDLARRVLACATLDDARRVAAEFLGEEPPPSCGRAAACQASCPRASKRTQTADDDRRREKKAVRANALLGLPGTAKTRAALERLATRGSGVFAASSVAGARRGLRALRSRGLDVGLAAPRDRENVAAPLLCCTYGEAPLAGNFLVLDDAHLVGDAVRGPPATRLLVDRGYDEVLCVGRPEVEAALRACFPDVAVDRVDRGVSATFGGLLRRRHGEAACEVLPDGAVAVVAFSRQAILGLAARFRGLRRVAVVHPSLPWAAADAELDRFRRGDADVLVAGGDELAAAGDLAVDHLVFAETERYDGRHLGDLSAEEAAALAALASGNVWTLDLGLGEFRCSEALVADAVDAAGRAQDADIDAILEPSLDELREFGAACAHLLPDALAAWVAAPPPAPWLRRADGARLLRRLEAVDAASLELPLKDAPGLEEVWALATLDVADGDVGAVAARILRGEVDAPSADALRTLAGVPGAGEDPRTAGDGSRALEVALARVSDARRFARLFPDRVRVDADTLAALYDAGAACCARALPGELDRALRCDSCGAVRAHVKKRTCRACLKAAADEERRLSEMRRTPSWQSLWANAAP